MLISFCLSFIVTGHKLQLQQRQNGGDRHNHDDQQSPQRSSDGGGDIQPFDYEIDGSSSDYNDIDEKSPRLRHREATSKARKKSYFYNVSLTSLTPFFHKILQVFCGPNSDTRLLHPYADTFMLRIDEDIESNTENRIAALRLLKRCKIKKL